MLITGRLALPSDINALIRFNVLPSGAVSGRLSFRRYSGRYCTSMTGRPRLFVGAQAKAECRACTRPELRPCVVLVSFPERRALPSISMLLSASMPGRPGQYLDGPPQVSFVRVLTAVPGMGLPAVWAAHAQSLAVGLCHQISMLLSDQAGKFT